MSHVDTAKTITHVSLCAGYGGIDIGLGRALPGLRTIAFSEIEAFACANLVAKMEAGLLDAAPIWTDLKTFPWDEFRDSVDILSTGYPCQPFSAAGKRAGADDPRHLWPYIADGIVRMRPRACFFENVEGHITLGLRDVLQDLATMGYRTTWGIFSAAEVGAPHQRKRVFIFANRQGERVQRCWSGGKQESQAHAGQALPLCGGDAGCGNVWPSRPGEPQHGWEPPRVVVDAKGKRAGQRSELCSKECGSRGALPRDVEQSGGDSGLADNKRDINEGPDRLGRREREQGQAEADGDVGHGNGEIEPALGRDFARRTNRVVHAELCQSCDNRTDELRLLGNGVVPATAEKAFRTLMKELSNEKTTVSA
jgi:DNA (cytosine-5)-methyltransferase 1